MIDITKTTQLILLESLDTGEVELLSKDRVKIEIYHDIVKL